mgnify:CR=1 FL=1
MISIREMTAADEGAVMEMVDRFYHSPAVEHEGDPAVLRRSFQAAVDPAEPLIQGLVLEEDGRPVGYHYMCIGYSAEVGCCWMSSTWLPSAGARATASR